MIYVSRAGEKLEFALNHFGISVNQRVCADLGCSTGGFTDCLLKQNAQKVYSVDTAYGVLEYKLRSDSRVVVMERKNALHVTFPEPIDFISIDVGWTPQRLIIPHALSLLSSTGQIISLLKPHYEAKTPYLSESESDSIAEKTINQLKGSGINILGVIPSPITGEKAKNKEFLLYIRQAS